MPKLNKKATNALTKNPEARQNMAFIFSVQKALTKLIGEYFFSKATEDELASINTHKVIDGHILKLTNT